MQKKISLLRFECFNSFSFCARCLRLADCELYSSPTCCKIAIERHSTLTLCRSLFHLNSHDLDYLDDHHRRGGGGSPPSLSLGCDCVWQAETVAHSLSCLECSPWCEMRSNGRSTLQYIWEFSSPACGLISLSRSAHTRRRRASSQAIFALFFFPALWSHVQIWKESDTHCEDCYGSSPWSFFMIHNKHSITSSQIVGRWYALSLSQKLKK
jgi:hypothetical protein